MESLQIGQWECGGLPAPCSGAVVEPVVHPGADLMQEKELVKCSVASHRHLGLNYFNMFYLKLSPRFIVHIYCVH